MQDEYTSKYNFNESLSRKAEMFFTSTGSEPLRRPTESLHNHSNETIFHYISLNSIEPSGTQWSSPHESLVLIQM